MATGTALPTPRIACTGYKESSTAIRTFLVSAITAISLPAISAEKVTYDDHVRPIFADRCLSCHNPDKAKGGLDLTTYSSLMQGGSSGEIVNAGEPDSSRLFRSVAHVEEPFMPPKADKLTDQRLKVMRDWIAGGLLENSGSKAKAGKPAFKMALAQPSTGKPEGPPPMPEHLVLAPAVTSQKPATPSDIISSPWAPLIALAVPRQVLLYNSNTLRLEGVLPFPEGNPSSLAFSRNGSLLVAGGGRGGKSGLVVGWMVKTGQRVFEIGSEFDAVLAADITADHKLIALGGPGRRIKIYSTSDGQEVANIKKHTDWVTSLAFSPDGILLATGDRNGGLYVWESETANPFYTLKAHTKSITAISWRADSNLVASASEDGSVRLWEMNGGKQVKNWNAHSGGVTDMAYAADGRIATCGRDRQAKVWDGNGIQKSVTKEFSDIPVSTCLSHDGNRFIAADWVGNVRVFNSADGKRIGDLVGNPPAIDTRIARALSMVQDREKELALARKHHSGKLSETIAAKEKLTGIRSQVSANSKQAEAAKSAREQARAILSTGKENHSATMGKVQAVREQAKKIEAELNALPATAENRAQMEAELKKLHPMIEQQVKELAAIQAGMKKAERDINAAQKSLDAATKALSSVSEKLKPAQEHHAMKTKEVSASQSSLDGLEQKLATTRNDQKHWQAALINVDRHKKLAIRPGLEAEVEQLELARKEAEQSHRLSINATTEAAKVITEAQEAEAASLNTLNAAQARLPVLEWELRLNELIATQQRQAMSGIREAMEEAPATIKPKIQSAIDEAGKVVATADEQTSRIKKLIQTSVANAQNLLNESRSTVAGTQKALTARQTEQTAALAKMHEATKAHAAGTEKIGQLDAEISELQKRYTGALPGNPVSTKK